MSTLAARGNHVSNIQATIHLMNKHCEMLSLMQSERDEVRITRTFGTMGKEEVSKKQRFRVKRILLRMSYQPTSQTTLLKIPCSAR